MRNDTLVLNRSYIPVHISDWHRIMALLYKEHANALDEDYIVYPYKEWIERTRTLDKSYKRINTINFEIAVPDIVVLTKYDKLPTKEVKFSRQGIFQRDKHTCQYCGKKFKADELTKDHVTPKGQGGGNNWTNLVTACNPCNSEKGNRTPKQAGMELIRRPEEPKWYNPLTKLIHHPNLKPNWKLFLKHVGV